MKVPTKVDIYAHYLTFAKYVSYDKVSSTTRGKSWNIVETKAIEANNFRKQRY